jgi:YegS/Rv2252/BmrU family lipid kinase
MNTQHEKIAENIPRYGFVINPISGGKNKKGIEKLITATFLPHDTVIKYTRREGQGYKIARKYVRKGISCCIAVGGDGTVNEVASALVNTNSVLGIIPAGSGNGLARHLGIPSVPSRALELIKQHAVRSIDAGKINGRNFFCTCGIGFDARVGYRFAQEGQRGLLGYIRSAILQFFRYRAKKYQLQIDERKMAVRAFLITVANAGQYGNNIYISPGADIEDGLLDICILQPFPKTALLPIGIKLLGGKIDKSTYLEVIRGKKVILKGKKKRQILHYDGEPLKVKGKIKIRILPGALKVIAPPKEGTGNSGN